jgi:hypothetical protein
MIGFVLLMGFASASSVIGLSRGLAGPTAG